MASPPLPPAEPSFANAPLEPPPPGQPPAPDDRRKLLIWFGSACAALLAVLVAVIIYGVFINKPETTSISAGTNSTSKSATPTPPTKSSSTKSTSESPTTASGSGQQASDGGLTFEITGTETASSVKYQDAPVTKTAQGEFLVVHMTVLNSGSAQGTFLATLQKLNAGGTTYSIDDEATAYLNGTWADLAAPGDTAEIAIAFDVPQGTSPESLEVHGAPMSTGVQVPLS
jgi:cytoskeletal protein RodZ